MYLLHTYKKVCKIDSLGLGIFFVFFDCTGIRVISQIIYVSWHANTQSQYLICIRVFACCCQHLNNVTRLFLVYISLLSLLDIADSLSVYLYK